MQQYSMIYNRLVKNKKKLKNYLKTYNIQAYRLYNKDIPEFPYIIDIYDQNAIVYDKGNKINSEDQELIKKTEENKAGIVDVLTQLMKVPRENIIFKNREVKKGRSQYEKLARIGESLVVEEGALKFKVNLLDYLDTGLFLDHRPLRQKLCKISESKTVLNLFAYTGSLSVAAAHGGGKTTTVDMSKTYIEWAKENFILNELTEGEHHFIQMDVLKYIKDLKKKFDIILLDPPSFSNSKRMDETFDVQRDHTFLIQTLMKKLNKGGTLIFSNNNRKFKLDESIEKIYSVRNISEESIPQDFRDKKIHVCFEIKKAP